MSRIMSIITVISISIGTPSLCSGNGPEILKNGAPLSSYLSTSISTTCDSLQTSLRLREDSLDMIMGSGLRANDQCFVTLNDNAYFLLLMSCAGNAELLLIDSARPDVVLSRLSMNKPGMHAYMDRAESVERSGFSDANRARLLDINKDGSPEIEISLSAGAHGLYTYFVSLDKNGLRLITDDNGNYQFFAIRGGVNLKDLNGDGILEILVPQNPGPNEISKYTVYRWEGAKYKRAEKLSVESLK